MPVTDALAYVHGTGSTGAGAITGKGTSSAGDDIFTTAAGQYSNIELDLGAAFPSLVENAYTTPPERLGDGGVEFGLHMVVSVAVVGTVGGMTTGTLAIVSAATTAATTVITSRTFTIAQLGVAGRHWFLPVDRSALLEFVRAKMTSDNAADSGKGIMWFGPRTGGEQ